MKVDEYLTVREFAQLMKVSERTALRRVQAGNYRTVRIGKQWRIAMRNGAPVMATRKEAA